MNVALNLLLHLVDEGFDHQAWHGTTLLGSLRGVTATQAARRPSPNRHNIWELAVHAAYWKYAVRRRLTGEKRGSFACAGSNWFVRPSEDVNRERAWRADVRLLIDEHRRLREAIAVLTPRDLKQPIAGKPYSAAYLIRGIAAHDLYHAGQIQLLKKLEVRS
ncbi:MAG: hypothetical protein A3H97_12680 [Acidobacteria bacterium RIFCSPLOWO2_02_FULL_65_29]|nr:MAG: hypothetical protein A3H97_12680 [Acidobacteria bacterium RIFCSPLOWO2_02_FULL_65_29]